MEFCLNMQETYTMSPSKNLNLKENLSKLVLELRKYVENLVKF